MEGGQKARLFIVTFNAFTHQCGNHVTYLNKCVTRVP